MKVYRVILVLVSLIMLSPIQSIGDSEVILSKSIQVSFQIDEVFFLIESVRGVPERFKGQVRRIYSDSPEEGEKFDYAIALSVSPTELPNVFNYSILAVGKNGELTIFDSLSSSIEELQKNQLAIDHIRQSIITEKLRANSLESELDAKNKEISEKQEKIYESAEFLTILDLDEKIREANNNIAGLEDDIASLREFINHTRNLNVPKNYSRRELALTKQIALLTDVVKATESTESQRAAEREATVNMQLQQIARTRFDDETQLLQELRRLKSIREKLESRLDKVE